jgi:hypothetical protein
MQKELEIEFGPTRAITVVLNEAEWSAFMAIEPHPVAWVRQRIQERLQESGAKAPAQPRATA